MSVKKEKPKEPIIQFVFRQKYRLNLGVAWLGLLNFSLLILAASDKLQIILGLSSTNEVALLMLPLGFFSVWFMGYVFDRKLREPYRIEKEHFSRSYAWRMVNGKIDLITKKLGITEKFEAD